MNHLREMHVRGAMLFGLFGGAALGCGPGVEGSSLTPPVSTETPNAIVCNQSSTLEDREFYVLSAMKKKLADFPELSSEVSSDPPTDCETARDFFAGYQRYLKLYPDFDSNQELGPAPADPGASDDGPLPKLTVKKISDGVPPTPDFDSFPRAPVAKITHLASSNTVTPGGWCSASFIAKNWVVTAAHCMAITRPASIPFSQLTAGDLFGYARYRVDWPGADGNLIPTATLTSDAEDVLQHPDPRFIGRSPRGNDPGFTKFDFALLYFREQRYDTVLPPRAETGAAMRIAMFPPDANQAIEAAGFATGVSGEQSGVLTRGTFTAPLSIVEPRGTIERDVRSPTEPTLCKGDSGGPAYRMVNIPPTPLPGEVPFEQAPTRVPVMHGVNSAGLPPEQCRVTPPNPPPDGCPLPSACSVPGEINVWTRTDPQRLFIEERMALWQHGPLFQCREGHEVGTSVNTFIECWGMPCAIDRNCTANEFCRRPAEAFADASCQTCQGACGCIVGQCIPFR